MARRADHSREELRAMAINAGLKIIEAEGFNGLSGRKVASAIGYTVGTLYNIFNSYDDLILHINATTLDCWYDSMRDALREDKSGRPVHVLAKAYIGFANLHAKRWMALFEHRLSEDTPLPEWYAPKLTRFFTLTEAAILPLLQGNVEHAHKNAHILWAAIHGICILSLTGKLALVEADTAESMAMALVDRYVAGLRA